MEIKDICNYFKIDGEITSISPIGNGHINNTYLVTSKFGDVTYKYTLQRINDYVFNNVDNLMSNIRNVTRFMADEIVKEGGDSNRETLQLVGLQDDSGDYIKTELGYFRMYHYIDNVLSLDKPRTDRDFSESAVAYANFIKRLTLFPVHRIYTVIPNFHNTVKRLNSLKLAVKNDKMGRLKGVLDEVRWMSEREKYAGRITTLLATHSIPTRVTHNDMKLNNVLIDKDTGHGLAVVDLDTVMTGSLLYDYGDAIRSGCNTASENEVDINKVDFNVDLYKVYTKTFVEEMADYITPLEKKHLLFGACLMTYENAVRFLTDYLNGDLYFKIAYEDENLMRTRTQMKLVECIEDVHLDLTDWTLKL